MNTVEPLKENGTSLVCVGASQALAAPVRHLVAEVKPLFFHQNLEALKCPALVAGNMNEFWKTRDKGAKSG